MTFDEFDKLLATTVEDMAKLGTSKGREYANHDTDRLANFKEIAAEIGITPNQVCYVYMAKHLRSIAHYIKSDAKGQTVQTSEPINGRIRDAQLYLVLLEGLIVDSQRNEVPVRASQPMSAEDAVKALISTGYVHIEERLSTWATERTYGQPFLVCQCGLRSSLRNVSDGLKYMQVHIEQSHKDYLGPSDYVIIYLEKPNS